MRCRKVRSYLSAYCNDELNSSHKLAISEHLSTCSACRCEEAVYRSMSQASKELPKLMVSSEFNSKLLNRIAQERFAQTRSKAYLPRRAPIIRWNRAIPAFATACLAVLLAVVAFSPQNENGGYLTASTATGLDDSYLTVQPVSDANTTTSLKKNWSLSHQLAQWERMNRMSKVIIQQAAWDDLAGPYGRVRVSPLPSPRPVPYMPNYYKVCPVVQTYMSPESPSNREAAKAY